jgi:hypothetical protein
MWLRKVMRRHAALVIIVLSYLGGMGLRVVGFSDYAKYISLPALVLLAWGVLGILVTLDDDLPGGWSNPDGDGSIWRHTLMVLGIGALALALLVAAVYV